MTKPNGKKLRENRDKEKGLLCAIFMKCVSNMEQHRTNVFVVKNRGEQTIYIYIKGRRRRIEEEEKEGKEHWQASASVEYNIDSYMFL